MSGYIFFWTSAAWKWPGSRRVSFTDAPDERWLFGRCSIAERLLYFTLLDRDVEIAIRSKAKDARPDCRWRDALRNGVAIAQISYANLPIVRMARACVRGKERDHTETSGSSCNTRS